MVNTIAGIGGEIDNPANVSSLKLKFIEISRNEYTNLACPSLAAYCGCARNFTSIARLDSTSVDLNLSGKYLIYFETLSI